MEEQYARHLENKARRLASLLARAGLDIAVPAIHATSLREGYRTRMQWKIFPGEKRPRILGRDPRKGAVPADEVMWMLPAGARVQARAVLSALEEEPPDSPVAGCEMRWEHGGPGFYLILNVGKTRAWDPEDLRNKLRREVPGLIGAAVPSRGRSWGLLFLRHCLPGGIFAAAPGAFFQTNLGLLPGILKEIRSRLIRTAPERILDLYCGVGLLSLSVGTQDTWITGVDCAPPAIESARINARIRGFGRARFTADRVERFLEKEGRFPSSDLTILNPSRAGCTPEVIAAVAAARPETAAVMSCNPVSAARDLALLIDRGYRVESMSAWDMFPFTSFLETFTVLTRSGRTRNR